MELIYLLSEALNFTFRLNPVISFDKETHMENDKHLLFDDLTYDLVLKMGSSACQKVYEHHCGNFFVAQHFTTTYEFFAVPLGAPYSAYDKFILPFDLDTWIFTFITFFVAFAMIFIVYLLKVETQNLVFGERVSYPSLNILAHFFGLSQVVMPTKNFARFIVMAFILLSFMIRNLYQG
jgi:hypothetical protein